MAGERVFSAHCHDDLGLATANTLAAIGAGARQVEVTINGLGERAGNAPLEEVVMALKTRGQAFGATAPQVGQRGINTRELVPTSRLVSKVTGLQVPVNKSVVGVNAFAHEAGIHQDGVIKERATYEIMSAVDVGWDSNRLVLGKHSGRHGVAFRLAQLGFELDEEAVEQVYTRLIEVADQQKEVSDRVLRRLAEDATSRTQRRPHVEIIREQRAAKSVYAGEGS
jgi:2-isopropylmalate synthase